MSAIQPGSFDNVPGLETEKFPAAVLREIDEANTGRITDRLNRA